ncbi:MAG: N-acetyltransferase [Deltaproteobacteria bacterium]|nr:N-acetyltransferase [Deltaproteobacteria bacterium]
MTIASARVRAEAPADADAVREVVTRAFGRTDEARLVDALRAAGKATIALVGERGGRVAGYVAFSPVTLDGAPLGLGLAPLAVAPEAQRAGIGAALVRAGLDACRTARVDVVVVLGSPVYYGRFGFVAAEGRDLRSEYDVPPGVFQALELRPGTLGGRAGVVRYAEEFAGF